MLSTILFTGLIATAGVKATAGANSVTTPPTVTASWASSFQGVWALEEATTATRVSSGSCTTSCGLARVGDTTNDSVKVQGTYSNVFDQTLPYDALSCTNANCGSSLGVASSGGTGGSVTFGCFEWPTVGVNNGGVLVSRLTGSAGYELSILGDVFGIGVDTTCKIDSTSATFQWGGLGLQYWQGQWQHAVCVFNDTANTLTTYVNGESKATAAPTSVTSNTTTFYLGSNGAGYHKGKLDECFVYKGTLTAASVCRICSCNVDGANCTYDSTTNAWLSKGRNSSLCNGCTLPADPTAGPA